MSAQLQEQILDQLRRLPENQQEQVLHFAQALAAGKEPIGRPGKELLRFAGAIPAADVERMAEAIEEGCERVDLNEW